MHRFDIPGAPDVELNRSVAAVVTGRLAAMSGLQLSHFEHRVALPLPAAWLPDERPDLGAPAGWQDGVLPESKYHHHRNDNPVGSFHPGHRAKWTAHELCHALVGFAWRPGASLLFHALAARLSEVLPVALWYFFDEAGLHRCPDHADGGPLFDLFCPACEAAATRPGDPVDSQDRWYLQGRAFVENELAAVRRSVRTGRPEVHRFITLDLCSDGMAYAAAHARRLADPLFAEHVERFFPAGCGWHDSLEGLEARVIEVMDAITGVAPLTPLSGSRARWVAQDVAWRLATVRAQTDGEVRRALDGLVDGLAGDPGDAALQAAFDGYTALHADYVLPEPADVFAVGYPLPIEGADGRAAAQVRAGVEQVLPGTAALLGDALDEEVGRFVAADGARGPLARRFARWLAAEQPGGVADLAAYEAAVRHPPPVDRLVALPPDEASDDRLEPASGLEILRATLDVMALESALSGAGYDAGFVGRTEVDDTPRCLAVLRTPGGELAVAEISEGAADALEQGALDGLEADERDSLLHLGLIRPVSWRL